MPALDTTNFLYTNSMESNYDEPENTHRNPHRDTICDAPCTAPGLCCISCFFPCFLEWQIATKYKLENPKDPYMNPCLAYPALAACASLTGAIGATITGVGTPTCIAIGSIMVLASPATTFAQTSGINNNKLDCLDCCNSVFCNPCQITANYNNIVSG
jgi:hypothetical protein